MGEVALGVAVLFAAGLLLRSFREMQTVDPGFQVDNTLSARLLFPVADYPDRASIPLFIDELETRLAARPGVQGVGTASVLPPPAVLAEPPPLEQAPKTIAPSATSPTSRIRVPTRRLRTSVVDRCRSLRTRSPSSCRCAKAGADAASS